MNKPNNIKKLFRKSDVSIEPELDKQIMDDALPYLEQTANASQLLTGHIIWRNIMKSKIAKLATAAAVLIILLTVFITTTPTAIAIDKVIDAYDNIRYIYIKEIKPDRDVPNEFWIQSDKTGRVVKARYCLPQTEDGTKIITWNPEKTEIWFKTKGGYHICQSSKVESWMQYLVTMCQPKIIMQKLLEQQKAGKVEIDIQEPKNKQSSGIIVSTCKAKGKKEIYYINPATDLITHIEFYSIKDNQEVLVSTIEFHDYNVPINENMFTLKGEVPDDAWVSDQLNQITGVAQDDMTDEQAAEETVRQFYQALIDKDYKKAGLIMGGMHEDYIKNNFGNVDIIKIVSVGSAKLQLNWVPRGYRVNCELEIINAKGQKVKAMAGPYVRPGDDERYPNHWNITGGFDVIEVVPGLEEYKKMTPKQIAETFFQACADEDWDEFEIFCPDTANERMDQIKEKMKNYLGGLEIISIGEPFQKSDYAGWFVPYEIRLKSGEIKKHNLAIRNDNPAGRYFWDGGI